MRRRESVNINVWCFESFGWLAFLCLLYFAAWLHPRLCFASIHPHARCFNAYVFVFDLTATLISQYWGSPKPQCRILWLGWFGGIYPLFENCFEILIHTKFETFWNLKNYWCFNTTISRHPYSLHIFGDMLSTISPWFRASPLPELENPGHPKNCFLQIVPTNPLFPQVH